MIYFIRDSLSGLVKIGYSADPWRRLVKMRADCPSELTLAGVNHGDRAAERELHARFSALRVRGEWFRPDTELEAVIALANIPRRRTARPRTGALGHWMSANGETDQTLARRLGKLSRSQVNRIRNGRRTSVEAARALEEITKIPAAKFVMGEAA